MVFLPGIGGQIAYSSPETPYTDLLITHYPNALYLKETLLTHRQIPLWSDLVHSGAPFVANPLAGLFYIPGWLALFFPLPAGLSLVLAAHAIFGAWGMYLFLKQEGSTGFGSVFGALVFSLAPKIWAHYGAGHVSLIYAISWTPWLFIVSKKDSSGWKTGLAAAMLFLADPRWALPAGLLWISHYIAHRHKSRIIKSITFLCRAGTVAALIASPLIISMLEYVSLSTRGQMTAADIQLFSLPLTQLIGVMIPGTAGNVEWFVYLGGISLLLLFSSLGKRNDHQRIGFWLVWILLSLVMAVIPAYLGSWILKIPGISLLRVPARNIFLAGFSIAVISARSIDGILDEKINLEDQRKLYFVLLAGSLAAAIGMSVVLHIVMLKAAWGWIVLALGAFLLILTANHILDKKLAGFLLLLLLVVDCIYAGVNSITFRERAIEESEVLNLIFDDSTTFRTYSPSYSLSQDRAAEEQIRLADGVDPLQIKIYADYMLKATGVRYTGYSVTIPAFSSGNPEIDNLDSNPDPFLLGLVNVKYVISAYELNEDRFDLLGQADEAVLYQNESWIGPAWIEDGLLDQDSAGEADTERVEILVDTPNRMELIVQGPGRLVISEIDYPGWRAQIDGDPIKIQRAYGILRSLEIPPGGHSILLAYRPFSVYGALLLAAVGIGLGFWMVKREVE